MLLKRNLIAGVIVLTSVFSPLSSFAAKIASNTTKATATMSNACLLSTTDISFGVLDLVSGETDANGSISVLCTKGTSFVIDITYGHPEAQQSQAANLVGQTSGDIVTYVINSTYHSGSKWGVDYPVTTSGTGVTQTFVTYGRALFGYYGHSRYPTPDNYSDTVSVKLTY